jgi:hypothetical protein
MGRSLNHLNLSSFAQECGWSPQTQNPPEHFCFGGFVLIGSMNEGTILLSQNANLFFASPGGDLLFRVLKHKVPLALE